MKNHISKSLGQRIIRALILSIVCIAFPVHAWAETEQGTALVSWNNKTGELNFFYIPPETHYIMPVGREEKWYHLPEKFDSPPVWSGNILKHVIFQPSFADYRPTSTANWFYNCTQLTDIEGLENLNTEDVTDMSFMFCDCEKLEKIDVGDFVTGKVESMSSMFRGCKSLKQLDLSCFNTSNVTWMSEMFSGCQSLTTVDVSGFNTENVKALNDMFNHCESLEELYLGSFDTHNVTRFYRMFEGCKELKTVIAGEKWTTENNLGTYAYTSMFDGCDKLVGGKGTSLASLKESGTIMMGDTWLARIDEGPDNPGLFTADTNGTLYDETGQTMAYTVLYEGTLTFYYDNKVNSRIGYKYRVENSYSDAKFASMPGWYAKRNTIVKAVFDPSFKDYRPTSTAFWLYNCASMTSVVGMENLNTSQVTNMSSMFRFCYILPSLDVSHFDTSNVTDMSFLFCYCSAVNSLDMTKFKTDKVVDMQHMFHTCPVSELDLRSFNTSNVQQMSLMFCDCNKVKTIYASDTWSTDKVKSSMYMFNSCKNLVGGMGTKFDSRHTDKEYAQIDGGLCDPGYLTGEYNGTREPYAVLKDSTLTFYYDWNMACREGTIYPIGEKSIRSWDYSCAIATKTVSFDISFADYRPLQTKNWFAEFIYLTKIENIENLDMSEVTDMSYMFFCCKAIPTLDLSSFNTRKVKNMFALFYECFSLTQVNVSSFNTSNVTRMGRMFCDCKELPAVDVRNFNTSKVEDMFCMFARCEKLVNLDLSKFDVSNVTNIAAMFTECRSLKYLDISKFNTRKVKEYDDLFEACESLAEIDVSSFDTRNATSLRRMFVSCKSLEVIDISNFFTSNVSSMQDMFYDCRNLRTIYVGNGWTTKSVIYGTKMFYLCNNLQGEAGTRYDNYYVDDYTYAHIDGGPSNPGYFTYKEYDETKGVEDVRVTGRMENEAMYNLQGIRLKEPVKGLYIKNGKKYLKR